MRIYFFTFERSTLQIPEHKNERFYGPRLTQTYKIENKLKRPQISTGHITKEFIIWLNFVRKYSNWDLGNVYELCSALYHCCLAVNFLIAVLNAVDPNFKFKNSFVSNYSFFVRRSFIMTKILSKSPHVVIMIDVT